MKPTESIAIQPAFHAAIQQSVAELAASQPTYDWVGVYLLEGDALTLRDEHYLGEATLETSIPLSEGLCGAAARAGETVVVDDVRSDPRHIVCSITTRSEIGLPIVAAGQVIGVLDVDSDTPAAFGADDQRELEAVAAALAEAWAQRPAAV
ncbi:MAG: GAF domain-containing protein [Candidatus Neomarinimicrobiota bacterium]